VSARGRAYVGRFAPSPTGPLHLGSLLAAVGSFVDARHHGGRWLVRMEDLDSPRVSPGCADEMLRTLEAFGLNWDGTVEYQSRRKPHYLQALSELTARNLTFQCSCTRAERSPPGGYPGSCRAGPRRAGPTATRFRVEDQRVRFEDRIQGECTFDLRQLGDVVVRRRDGVFAYQLAVVVDDALQGVTDVVRGADLLDNTPWQLALQRALGLPTPRYAHLPLVVEPRRGKLAKSRRSLALAPARASALLHEVLTLLGQEPPLKLKFEPPGNLLAWGAQHWRPAAIRGVREVRASAPT
jgi:glutamyl-Q tRNA(Asp) synthetase